MYLGLNSIRFFLDLNSEVSFGDRVSIKCFLTKLTDPVLLYSHGNLAFLSSIPILLVPIIIISILIILAPINVISTLRDILGFHGLQPGSDHHVLLHVRQLVIIVRSRDSGGVVVILGISKVKSRQGPEADLDPIGNDNDMTDNKFENI